MVILKSHLTVNASNVEELKSKKTTVIKGVRLDCSASPLAVGQVYPLQGESTEEVSRVSIVDFRRCREGEGFDIKVRLFP